MSTFKFYPAIGVALIVTILASFVACKDNSTSVENKPTKETEKEAVGKVLGIMAEGFAKRDAEMASSIYSSEAQWLNAFGDWREGQEAIQEKLKKLFSSSEFNSGEMVGEPTGKVRILKPDVAVAWTYQEIKGQKYPNGDEVPLRKNHSLLLLLKKDSEWIVEAQIFMDENYNPNK
ncbi:YybH family protein [Fodinibius halophilus]|uniref:SgcJ/EcaC family oxidoreductase n=1 Tax=Fodinibius halophilus TaxID=1736908 RepID=A0A6M1TFT3_9BACT|nr:SgcJ/EcaC family oxidoreductase [Fodinibius halophilus]NGP89644.1 SgcJ/EcaC family oxidoreductase [Fodinibius halophilus]